MYPTNRTCCRTSLVGLSHLNTTAVCLARRGSIALLAADGSPQHNRDTGASRIGCLNASHKFMGRWATTNLGTAPQGAPPAESRAAFAAALSATSITVPHALGLWLVAFAPLAGQVPVAALALWSAALPSALLTLLSPRPGVIYAPTTVVALLFAAVVATVTSASATL